MVLEVGCPKAVAASLSARNCAKTKTGYLWAVLRDDRGWCGASPPGVVFHYRPARKGEYSAEILEGFNGTIHVDAYGGYTHLVTPKRRGANR